MIDPITQSWIRNPSDESAAAAGMRFDPERGEQVCDWIQTTCHLYEGALAGETIVLMPYQRDFIMRLFGWVRWSEEWKGWIRRFTHASLFASKKNGKSPLCASIGLYLECGDGEQGQHVYVAAKNGDQAKISQRHAFEMVKQSPQLFAECDLNKTTYGIHHNPTNSSMTIVTGDDSRGAKAKEGLNGSVLVDELHVASREVMERVSRAGISRREPLQLAFSTAGDDPSSIGYERCAYGRQVNLGERLDLNFLHVEYTCPENLTDAEIEDRLEELGKMANPAWGTLVKPSEFRADWERSKGMPREVARFKQYRLNIWVGSTNQWLDTTGWELGKRAFTPADLQGRECFIGLDLSRTRDMTASPIIFPWPEDGYELPETSPGAGDGQWIEAVRVWPMFWLPEQTAKARRMLFPFEKWAADGAIKLTRGAVVDYKVVVADIVDFVSANQLIVLGIYFDQTYAEILTQDLQAQLGLGDDQRVAVPQSVMTLSPLCKEVERRVSVGLVQHPGNAVMTWQVGHCEVWTDKNQNIRPVKPSPHSGKSIDGIMGIVDAFAGLSTYAPGGGGGGFERW